MKYETLSEIDTEVWRSNLNKTLLLVRKILSTANALEMNIKSKIIEKFHANAYKKLYSQLFYGLYDESDIIISSGSGNCFSIGGLFCDLGMQLSNDAMEIIRYTNKMTADSSFTWVTEIHECWSVYASKPFDIEESDVLTYMHILKIHGTCKDLLQTIGAYDEALDLVKDSRSRGG